MLMHLRVVLLCLTPLAHAAHVAPSCGVHGAFSPALRCAPRARPCHLLDGGGAGDDADDDDIMAELRKALADVGDDARAESDSRVIDGFVEDRKGQLNAPLEDLTRSLESVAEDIEEKVKNELAGVESDMLSRIDAAVEQLRRENAGTSFDPAIAEAGAPRLDALTAALPADALVVVAGAGTPLGRALLRGIGGSSSAWKLRALLTEGSKLDGVDCESATFAPFAPTALAKSLSGADAVVIISALAGGKGGVEPEVVPKLVKALPPSVRRVLVASSHGVERTDKLPFNMQNVFGQLDKQRGAEQEVVLKARKDMPSFGLLRLGKLKDDASTLRPASFDAPPRSRAVLAAGDRLGGELPCSTAAQVLVQALARPEAVNATFSLGAPETAAAGFAADAATSDADHWDDEFLKLVGPEIYRRPLSVLPVDETVTWLREWARRFLRPGQQLTTPVTVADCEGGVLLRFLTRATGFADFDVEESIDDKWAAAKPGVAESKAGKPDGALLLVAEGEPTPRVRVTRAEMDAEGVVVKEMSENTVLERLERDLVQLEKERARKM